jgi:CheY-like chemotaxis protein
LKILLVEDSPMNQKLATRLLQKLGHLVVVANNGQAALETIKAQSFDVVFMDIEMPVMGGIAATAAIRAKEKITRARIPIVALTADGITIDKRFCLQAGMDDYITKPVNLSQIKEALDRIMIG